MKKNIVLDKLVNYFSSDEYDYTFVDKQTLAKKIKELETTVYVNMNKLEKLGLVMSATSSAQGRRKSYKVTKTGLKKLVNYHTIKTRPKSKSKPKKKLVVFDDVVMGIGEDENYRLCKRGNGYGVYNTDTKKETIEATKDLYTVLMNYEKESLIGLVTE